MDEDWSNQYDVYIVDVRDGLAIRDPKPSGFQGLRVSLRDAREAAKALRVSGYAVLVCPCRYQATTISSDHGREIAHRRLKELRESGLKLSELGSTADGGAWWIFVVDDVQAQNEGYIPGTRQIAIDKIDGHVATFEEMKAFYALSVSP